MKVINLRGGLGNQILQLSYMLKKERAFAVNTQDYKLNSLFSESLFKTINSLLLAKIGILLRYMKSKLIGMRTDFDANILVDGYFQASIDEKVIPKEFGNHIYNQLVTIRSNQEKYDLIIHFRGGDYLTPVNQRIFEEINLSFYQDAISDLCFKNSLHLQDLKIAIITNDKSKAKSVFKNVLPENSDIIMNSELEDFSAIENCKYAIIPNSTFSLSARLIAHQHDKNKITYYPKRWFTEKSKMTGPNINIFNQI